MTFEEYEAFYNKFGYTPQGRKNIRKNLRYEYDKLNKKKEKRSDWSECREEAFRRNPRGEQFLRALTDEEYDFFISLRGEQGVLDPCHIIGKGECPKDELKNNPDNILIAPRYFHTYIDQYRDPFSENHEVISKEDRDKLWARFIGWDKLEELKDIKRGAN